VEHKVRRLDNHLHQVHTDLSRRLDNLEAFLRSRLEREAEATADDGPRSVLAFFKRHKGSISSLFTLTDASPSTGSVLAKLEAIDGEFVARNSDRIREQIKPFLARERSRIIRRMKSKGESMGLDAAMQSIKDTTGINGTPLELKTFIVLALGKPFQTKKSGLLHAAQKLRSYAEDYPTGNPNVLEQLISNHWASSGVSSWITNDPQTAGSAQMPPGSDDGPSSDFLQYAPVDGQGI
jgi:hypothetical protein